MLNAIKCTLLSLLFLLFGSCTRSVGTYQLPINRFSYNEALQNSTLQQTLLNIVRLRYGEPPYFLSVNSIVSQYELTKRGGVFSSSPMEADGVYGSADLSFSDRPTVTFTPLQGTAFVNRFMSPINISVVYMLLRSGWGVSHVVTPLIEYLGDYDAASIASRVVSSRTPVYKMVYDFTNVLRKVQHMGALKFRAVKDGDKKKIRFDILNFSNLPLSAQDKRILQKFHVNAATPYFCVVDFQSEDPHEFTIKIRTILGLFNYFSKGVEVPSIDVKNHRVPMTYLSNGETFDWKELTGPLFRVRVSERPPRESFVAVKYKYHWYYVADSDFDTKESIMLLNIIMGIYEGKIDGFLPVFTVNA